MAVGLVAMGVIIPRRAEGQGETRDQMLQLLVSRLRLPVVKDPSFGDQGSNSRRC